MATSPQRAILLLSCPEQKGIVAAVSDFLYRNDGNIVDADQHTDFESNLFLQRIEWEMDGFRLPREAVAEAFRPLAERFSMSWVLHFTSDVPRMAIFVSKLDHCLNDLLWRQRAGELPVDIPFVLSNHEDLRPVADSFGLPFHVHPLTPQGREEEGRRILARLADERIDLVVLARYMQVLGSEIVQACRGRMINIHHSFLPAFAGGRPYHQAYARGVKVIGATAHYVTEQLDEGPIVEQDVVRVSHRDSVEDMVRKGRDLERVVLARAVRLHARWRVLVYGNRTVVFD
jgi:formyltetrahydrofolate deformylase